MSRKTTRRPTQLELNSTTRDVGSEDAFRSEVLASDKPVLANFWAHWCGPSQMLAPIFEKIARGRSDRMAFVRIDADAFPKLALEYRLSAVPSLMLFDRGKVVERIIGFVDEATIVAMLDPYLASSKPAPARSARAARTVAPDPAKTTGDSAPWPAAAAAPEVELDLDTLFAPPKAVPIVWGPAITSTPGRSVFAPDVSRERLEAALATDKPVLVDFWAPMEWSKLRYRAVTIESVAAEMVERVTVVKLNVAEAPDVGARYRITGVPCAVLFCGGKEVARLDGFEAKSAILQMLSRHLDRDRAFASRPPAIALPGEVLTVTRAAPPKALPMNVSEPASATPNPLGQALESPEISGVMRLWLARLNEVAPSPAQSDAEAHKARQRHHWQQILQEAGIEEWDDDGYLDRMVETMASLGYAFAREVTTISPAAPASAPLDVDPEAEAV